MAEQLAEVFVQLSSTPVQVLPPDTSRLCIVFSVASGNTCTVTTQPAKLLTMNPTGMSIPGGPPVILTREWVGIAVTYGWWAISTGITPTMYVLYTYDLDRPYPYGPDTDKGLLLPPFATDPHKNAPGIDTPDPVSELVRQLKRKQWKR